MQFQKLIVNIDGGDAPGRVSTSLVIENEQANWLLSDSVMPTTEQVQYGLFCKEVGASSQMVLDYQDGGLRLTAFLGQDDCQLEHTVLFSGGHLSYLLQLMGILGSRYETEQAGDLFIPEPLPAPPEGIELTVLGDW